MRRATICVLAVSALAGLAIAPTVGAAESSATTYVVVYEAGASAKAAHAAIRAAGGKLVAEQKAIGVATVTSTNASFVTKVSRARAVYGAARNRPIGFAPGARPGRYEVESERGGAPGSAPATSGSSALRAESSAATAVAADPLAAKQWDMQAIHATADGSYAVNPGSSDVMIGVMDTGVDGSHPDIAPNFNAALSRNFTTDIPLVDGPCEDENNPGPDPCADPADVDDNGHGTHVASTIGSPLNGIGVAGVAPNVQLVNLRAGQDSGFFFLASTLNAMMYAGDVGIDVVNMSFYTDPWLFNCAANPADSPAEQLEQRTTIKATQRAINYGTRHGVTFIAAAGNESTDLSNPTADATSPDFPPGGERERTVDNSCLTVPTETQGVLSVSATGPTGRKAYYSNWGLGDVDVAAPGGDRREFLGTPQYNAPETRILAAYPESVGLAAGAIDPVTGEPTTPLVVKDTQGATTAYYQYIQGTSMASPHAVGVAALIVSQFGSPDSRHGGLTMLPRDVRKQLLIRATNHACPEGGVQHYPDIPELDAPCVGPETYNSFYGQGIVDALASLSKP